MAKPRSICVECQVEYRPHRIGIPIITMFGQPPKPYELGYADIYQCPGCKHTVVGANSFSEWPYRRHHDPDFNDAFLEATTSKRHNPIYVYENHLDVPGNDPRSRELIPQPRENGQIR